MANTNGTLTSWQTEQIAAMTDEQLALYAEEAFGPSVRQGCKDEVERRAARPIIEAPAPILKETIAYGEPAYTVTGSWARDERWMRSEPQPITVYGIWRHEIDKDYIVGHTAWGSQVASRDHGRTWDTTKLMFQF